MKMLISPSHISRQTPHSNNIYQTVSQINNRWFHPNNSSYIVGNRVNGNGIKCVAEDDVKSISNGLSRSPQSIITNSPSQSPASSIDGKEPTALLNGQPSPVAEPPAPVSASPSPQLKTERKQLVDAATTKQRSLENRAHSCLKRLRTLRSTDARRSLYGELKSVLAPRSRKSELDLSNNAVQAVCGDSLAAHNLQRPVSVLETPSEIRHSISDALSQLAFDVKRAMPDLADEDATDVEEEYDDAYFMFKEAQSLTENTLSAPVALPKSPKRLLEGTPAWRYEQERISLAARDSYLRLQISELDSRIKMLSEYASTAKTVNTSSSQSSDSSSSVVTQQQQQQFSCARARPFGARKRTLYRIGNGQQPPPSPTRLSSCVIPIDASSRNSSQLDTPCHCSCRSIISSSTFPPSSPTATSPVSCISCQASRRQTIAASQPDFDAETRLSLIDPAFHPKLSKLVGCDVLTSTTSFDRLDTAAACLLDHAYSADPILAKPKPSLPIRTKSTSPTTDEPSTVRENLSKKQPQPATVPSLPPIPLPAHLQKSNKLPNAFFVDPATLETASRLRVRKHSAASSSTITHNLVASEEVGSNKKLLLQKKRRLEQRKRLQLQRRKEQQRRKQQQQQKAKKQQQQLSLSNSRRSSSQLPGANSARSSIGSLTSPAGPGALLSASAPCGSIPATPGPVAVGSGGFDIDNVVIPPPTPTALLAAAQALAEAAVEIATPGFRKIAIEPIRPAAPKAKQTRLSAPALSSSSKPEQVVLTNGGISHSLSESSSTDNFVISSDHSAPATGKLSPTTDVFPTTPLFVAPLPPAYEDVDEVVYRRRHAPFEQQERARYLAIMQHTIAPRKIRDMAVNARPPSQTGKAACKGLSRSCTEEGLRRSSRVSAINTCPTAIDPECKPFVFPLSEAEWRIICAEKEMLLKNE